MTDGLWLRGTLDHFGKPYRKLDRFAHLPCASALGRRSGVAQLLDAGQQGFEALLQQLLAECRILPGACQVGIRHWCKGSHRITPY